MYHQVLLLLLALLAVCNAQLLSNPKRVYDLPTDGTVIKTIGAAMTTCSATLVIMDNSTECIKYADVDGVVYNSVCTPQESTAFDMFIYASAGYIINSEGFITIIDMYTANTIDVIGTNITHAVHPYKIGLYTSYAVPTLTHTWFMADGATNSSIYLPSWTITGNVNSYTSNLIVNLNNTAPIVCLFTPAGGIFMVSYEGGNTLFVYSWTVATQTPTQKYLYNITGFGEIGACSGDYYNRGWIWDKTCNCMKVIVASGTNNWIVQQSFTLPEVSNPRVVQATRNKVFLLDDNGVIRYDLPALSATFTPPPNPSCASVGTAARLNATWGSPPYVYPFITKNNEKQKLTDRSARVIPDQISTTSASIIPSFAYSYSGTVKYIAPYEQVFHLYDDTIAPEYQAIASSGLSSTNTPASVIAPYSGTSSWSMLMARGFQYGITTSTTVTGATISATYFQTLEMMVNPGNGLAGKFRIDMTSGTNYYYFDYDPSAFPANNWTKISIDLSMGPVTSWTKIVFADYSNSTSDDTFLYVDNIFLIPYNHTRILTVKDFCNVTVFSMPYPIDGSSLLVANISSETTSCNPVDAGGNANATNDGSLTALASGGTSPYKYAWSFTTQNTSTVNDLSPLGLANIIYDNAVNSVFTDLSSGNYSLTDTTFFRSAPYSVSLVPEGITSDIIFFTPAGISASMYTAVEFWVYGGPAGNQLIYAGLVSNQFDILTPSLIHRLIPIPSIPANVWTKVTYPIAASAGTFYGFVLRAIAGISQPTIYFDDIRFVNASLLSTVTDSANCAITNYVSVSFPPVLSLEYNSSNLKCYGDKSGAVSISVSGGTAPYSYNWNQAGLVSNSSANNLGESSYTVSVTDSNNCTSPTVVSVKIIQPAPLNITTQVQNPKCFGKNGTITAQVTGGLPSYSFAWSASGTQFVVPSRPAPLAIFTDSFHLHGSFKFSVSANVSLVCDGQSDSYASQSGYCDLLIVPSASSSSLFSIGCPKCIDFSQYSAISFWVNFIDTANIPNLTAQFISNDAPVYTQALNTSATGGWQQVTVTLPSSGLADSFTLTQSAVNAGAFLIDTIELLPISLLSNGTGVASSFVSTVQGTAGQYTLSVTDGNSCPTTTNVQIIQPLALNATFAYKLPSPLRASNGNIAANVTGGVPPYLYSWSGGAATTPVVGNLSLGTYHLVVTDANGCTLEAVATLSTMVVNSASHISPLFFLSPISCVTALAIAILFL